MKTTGTMLEEAAKWQQLIFTEEKIEKLFEATIKEQTGVDIHVKVDYLEDYWDTCVKLDIEDGDIPEALEDFGLSTEEWFTNRDILLNEILNQIGGEGIALTALEDECGTPDFAIEIRVKEASA